MTFADRASRMIDRVSGRLGREVKVRLRTKGAMTVASGVRAHTTVADVTAFATLQPEQSSEDFGSSVGGRSRVYRIPVAAFTGDAAAGPDRDDLLFDPPGSSSPWKVVSAPLTADRQAYDLTVTRTA